jgi:deazaflavin-dependent oxidoreductase (nitroreductase family)
VDIWLSHRSQGRLSVTGMLGFPMLILTTKGARTGILRETSLLYVKNNENVAVIASSLGSTNHPQWFRNLLSNPEASLSFEGRQVIYSFRQLEGTERQEYWQRMLEIYPGYKRYAELAAGRHIPVILFSPLERESPPLNLSSE